MHRLRYQPALNGRTDNQPLFLTSSMRERMTLAFRSWSTTWPQCAQVTSSALEGALRPPHK